MSVNRYKPHIYLIPEDDANRQLAIGFLDHEAVADRTLDLRDPAGGWSKVLEIFENEYLKLLRGNEKAHVVMLIDFDDRVAERREQFQKKIPNDVGPRVFLIGSKGNPETLKVEFRRKAFEWIGRELAQDCLKDAFELWQHPHLIHNADELKRLVHVVKPILFQGN